ncbi:division plane positioning ATPase MipZ [Govanella unica]|uniref:Division plane positioning ATPase MipZ n=1 Tax=Govanella unica TaxID=2975056 RepID=A0A9X3Z6H8_9PROT|nr:division plane positioning ATPase MipZ [Govania unica]MDA5193097.1 division plane positioning ATPase MipZ [Govania unica]
MSSTPAVGTALAPSSGHIIVLGNEKGGSGKSTSAMHIITGLLSRGATVGSIDVDSRQGSLSRYIENRRAFIERSGVPLNMPSHHLVPRSALDTVEAQRQDETARFMQSLMDLASNNAFVVVDCPGSDSYLSRIAHSYADTLLTPLNDSFIDFDILGRVDPETNKVTRPSFYGELVWESRKLKALRSRGQIDWVVMRNRMSTLDAHNKRRVGDAMTELEKRVGFRVMPGLCERVIYRELFLQGLTLFDYTHPQLQRNMTMSHVAARQELRELISGLNLPQAALAAAE